MQTSAVSIQEPVWRWFWWQVYVQEQMNPVCLILCFRCIMASDSTYTCKYLDYYLAGQIAYQQRKNMLVRKYKDLIPCFISPCKLLICHSSCKSLILGTLLLQDKSSEYSDKSGFWTSESEGKSKGKRKTYILVHLWEEALIPGLSSTGLVVEVAGGKRFGDVRTEEVRLTFRKKPERRNYQSSQGSVWCSRRNELSVQSFWCPPRHGSSKMIPVLLGRRWNQLRESQQTWESFAVRMMTMQQWRVLMNDQIPDGTTTKHWRITMFPDHVSALH